MLFRSVVNKVYEGRPNVIDHIKNGDIQLVINTSSGKRTKEDSSELRRTTVMYGLPYTTLFRSIKILQAMYAGALADSVLRMGREGILEKVTVEKKGEQMASGKIRAAQLVITKPQEVFEVLPEIFGCANWMQNCG